MGQIKSVDGFVFFRLYFGYSQTCNYCLPFSYSRWFFSETYLVTSAENNVLDPPNLKIFFGGDRQTPLQGSSFRHLR